MITHTVGKFQRHIHVAVVAADRLKVAQILAFADKLREEGVPADQQVTASNSQMGHLTGLSVSYNETLPESGL